MNSPAPITLLICALGGEGGGVLTEWLVETARHAGYACQATSIPGVAQRTGATTYYVEVFPVAIKDLGGRRPVFSLNPVPGALDAMISSELLETARQIGNGMTGPGRTLVLTSSARTLTTQERMQLGDGRTDAAELLKLVQQFSRAHQVFDMAAVAKEAGTVVSAVMLGAVAGSGIFPFPRQAYEAVVKAGGKGAEASLRGFGKGFEIVAKGKVQADYLARVMSDPEGCHPGLDGACPGPDPGGSTTAPAQAPHGLRVKPAMTSKTASNAIFSATSNATSAATSAATSGSTSIDPDLALTSGMAAHFPDPVRAIFTLGYQRLLDYQGKDYADLYSRRLLAVLVAECEADPAGDNDYATTTEMARWLALWMAFDDIVRVADLKSRASRWQRVHGEVKAGGGDLLKVYDHFKPGVPEFAALLPPTLARKLVAWDRRRVAAGAQPWALPLKIGTHSIGGMLALRTLAGMKWLRVRGSRFASEQKMIEQWLDGVVRGSLRDWQLGHEIARCGRLIKGYGATNERGKENLLHVLEHLACGGVPGQAAQAVHAAREAALADEAGKALDATLVQHGAPPRPVKAVPIRWVRKPRKLADADEARAPVR